MLHLRNALNVSRKLFQNPILNVNAVLKPHVFVALAITLHGAARYAGANSSKKHGNDAEQQKESFHNLFRYG
jgi:hypothetical protein